MDFFAVIDVADSFASDNANAGSTGTVLTVGASGSVDSPSAVEPTRSQKRTVTTLRCSREGSAEASAVPHELQNLASSAFSRPQLGHAATRGVYEGGPAARRPSTTELERPADTTFPFRS